jgi:hypothetical protein
MADTVSPVEFVLVTGGVIKMEELQPPLDSPKDYTRIAQALVTEYGPTARRFCPIESWPDELVDRDLTISDQTTDEPVADIDFERGSTGFAQLTIPADYTRPMDREPFKSIESIENLSPAGELVCRIFRLIDRIIISPNAELSNKRKLGGLLEELHQEHNYSPETIYKELLKAAQRQGDLPDKID